jgi:hypothetical protein
MPYVIVIMPRARRLIAEARDWWNMNRAAAPALLGDELDRAFDRIAENPNVGAPWPRRAGVRLLVLARVGFLGPRRSARVVARCARSAPARSVRRGDPTSTRSSGYY